MEGKGERDFDPVLNERSSDAAFDSETKTNGIQIQSCDPLSIPSTSRTNTSKKSGGGSVDKAIALTTRKMRKSKDTNTNNNNTTTTNDKINFLFSDTNPLCTQLYFRAVKYGSKYRREKSCSSPPPHPPPVPNVRQRERRHRRNSQAQRIRDEEKYEDYRMRVQLIQELNRHTALYTQIHFLESRKAEMRNILLNFGYQIP